MSFEELKKKYLQSMLDNFINDNNEEASKDLSDYLNTVGNSKIALNTETE